MQRLEVSCAVRHIYTSLGARGLNIRIGSTLSVVRSTQNPRIVKHDCSVYGSNLCGEKNVQLQRFVHTVPNFVTKV